LGKASKTKAGGFILETFFKKKKKNLVFDFYTSKKAVPLRQIWRVSYHL
jgi:hypothetical protein